LSEEGAGPAKDEEPHPKGLPLAAYLLQHGIKQISWSLKKSRPRGMYSLSPLDKTMSIQIGDISFLNPVEVDADEAAGWSPRKPKTVGKLFGELVDAYTIHKPLVRSKIAWPIASRLVKHILNNPPTPKATPRSRYHVEELHADVLVVGGGAAGLTAALEVARRGFKALLVEAEGLGGVMGLDQENPPGVGETGSNLIKKLVKMARRLGVKTLEKTRMAGFFEDHPIAYRQEGVRGGILYKIYTRETVIATGVCEPPALFPGNDLPGIFSSTTIIKMIEKYGVLPGERGVIIGNGHLTPTLLNILDKRGVAVNSFPKPSYVEAFGNGRIEDVEIDGERVRADFLVLSLGFQPDPRLAQQLGAEIQYSGDVGGFIPIHNEFMEAGDDVIVAGGVTGSPYGVIHLMEGRIAGLTASVRLGSREALEEREEAVKEYLDELPRHAAWKLKVLKTYHGEAWRSRVSTEFILNHRPSNRAFTCICEDVTTRDLKESAEMGFHSLEKVKRCTGLGTGYCQGRLCMGNACSYICMITGREPRDVGTIRSRPPISSIPLGALAEVADG